MWNRNYRLKPFGVLKKEIEIVKNKYGMLSFVFEHDSLTANRTEFLSFLQWLEKSDEVYKQIHGLKINKTILYYPADRRIQKYFEEEIQINTVMAWRCNGRILKLYGMEANVMYRVWKSICEGEKLSKEMYHKCKSEGLIK